MEEKAEIGGKNGGFFKILLHFDKNGFSVTVLQCEYSKISHCWTHFIPGETAESGFKLEKLQNWLN